MKKLMEINKDNYYVLNCHEIKAICDRDGCDVAVALIKFDQITNVGTMEDSKEFLHLINEQMRTKNPDGMTLDKLCSLMV